MMQAQKKVVNLHFLKKQKPPCQGRQRGNLNDLLFVHKLKLFEDSQVHIGLLFQLKLFIDSQFN